MKKLVALLIAITFFAGFSLMGCQPPAEPPKPAPAKEEAKPAPSPEEKAAAEKAAGPAAEKAAGPAKK